MVRRLTAGRHVPRPVDGLLGRLRRSAAALLGLAALAALLEGCVPGEPEGSRSRSGVSPGRTVGEGKTSNPSRSSGTGGVSGGSGADRTTAPARIGGLAVSPPSLDFGERGHGERATLDLELTNVSERPIRVAEMRPSCGCTTLDPPEVARPILPGHSSVVSVTMSSGRAMGTLDKYIKLRTDESPEVLRVPTTLRVFPHVRAEPPQLRFEGEAGGDAVTRTVDILRSRRDARSAGTLDFALEGIREGAGSTPGEASPFFRSLTEEIPGGVRVRVTLLPEHPEGRFAGTLVARLDGKPFHLPVSGEVFRALKQSPSYFNFNRVDPETPETLVEESTLSSIDGLSFSILRTTSSLSRRPGADLRVEVVPEMLEGGREHRLQARLVIPPGATPKGGFGGEVVIETDHPERREVAYRFFGFFPER